MNNNTNNTPNNNQNSSSDNGQNIATNNVPNINNTPLNTNQNIVNQTVSKVVSKELDTPQLIANNEVDEEYDDNVGPSKVKVAFLVIFFILVLVFVIFLPDISSIVKTGKFIPSSNEITNGILSCSMIKESDNTEITYDIDFSFTNKKLQTSTLKITTSSEDKNIINEKYSECKNIEDVSEKVSGIDVSCSSSSSISTMREDYTYNIIDNNNLTPFTEAGGTYPEHEFEQNIDDIKSSMIREGYDCKVRTR